ncbi:MAG: alanine racemase [Candidatus Methylacidiphilales bacterium]|nr:alanine racemase [Candidatus Methylacidiphilales bacterium]
MLERLKSDLPHRSWCEIDRSALRHNLRALAAITSAPEMMPMVKADAYGHGMIESARVFADSGASWIGCANVHEGMALRAAGIPLPVLLLSGFLPAEVPAMIEHRLTLTLSSVEEARQVAALAAKRKTPLQVQVKIDTGMGRLGVPLGQAATLVRKVWEDPNLVLTGVYSHYACSDSDPAFTRDQWNKFQTIPSPAGIPRHICNSAGLLALPASAGDLVRPGVAVYGISPLARFQSLLRPAMSWKSRIVGVRTVPRGTPLSYGATYRTPRAMRIGLASVGYGDGLFRALSNKGEVLVRGKRCRIVGRVTMDQILLDLGRVPRAAKGDEVVLLGRQGAEEISATEMARKAGTICYEVWCHITDRVTKIYR